MVKEEEIKKYAYEIWEREGHPQGEHVRHYLAAKRFLEEHESEHKVSEDKLLFMREYEHKLSGDKILFISDDLIEKIDQNRGNLSRAEFLKLCVGFGTEKQPQDQREELFAFEPALVSNDGEGDYVRRSELQEFTRNIKDLLIAYLGFL